MKKSIKILVKKLQQDPNGNLKGGFSAVKGGFKSMSMSGLNFSNEVCSNTIACSHTTNTTACTNTFSC